LKDEDPEKAGQYYVEFTKLKGANYPFTQLYTEIKGKALHFANEQAAFTIDSA